MILRFTHRSELLPLLCVVLLSSAFHVHSFADFDCHVSADGSQFDLTTLGGEHVVNRTRSTPPTTMIDSMRFNICADLQPIDKLPSEDQCPPETRVCLTKVNQKEHETDRITAVIPVAKKSTLDPKYVVSLQPQYLSLQLHGEEYSNNKIPQTFNLTIFCDSASKSEPQFVDYDGSRLDVEWRTPAGCPLKGDGGDKDKEGDKKPDEKPAQPEEVGSGVGWFFLVILLALAAYFGLGAYYNYTTYGATGYDLIPHRDFWKEVPYMLSDVVSHLCSSGRPRRSSSRGGYISV